MNLNTLLASLPAQLAAMRERHLSRNKRRDTTAMGTEGAIVLLELVARGAAARHPYRVADLGSGFSSAALRWLATQLPLEVWTVDTSARWLATTQDELRREGLELGRCYEFEPFAATAPAHHFDLLFVDIGPMPFRVGLAADGSLGRWLAPGGTIVLDDWHTEHYRIAMLPRLEAQGFTVTELPASRDTHGRYLASASRPTAA